MPFVRAVAQAVSEDTVVLLVQSPDRQFVSAVQVPSLSLATGGTNAARARLTGHEMLWQIEPAQPGHLAIAEPILGDEPLAAALTQAGAGWSSTIGHPMPWATVGPHQDLAATMFHYTQLVIGGTVILATLFLLGVRRRQHPASLTPVSTTRVIDTEQLKALQDLRDRGALSEDEFQRQKAALLAVGNAPTMLGRVKHGVGSWFSSMVPHERQFGRSLDIEQRKPKS